MEQNLVIYRINESKFRKQIHRDIQVQRVPLSKLKRGAELKLSDQRKMSVIQLTDDELRFMVDGFRTYTLNRHWQVLGTVKLDFCPSHCEKESERFAFYFETPVETPQEGAYDRMVELVGIMRQNAEDADTWKNIPLAQELMHLFKDCTPLRDGEINPELRMQAMEVLSADDLVPESDVPRLMLSFYQYWEINNELRIEEDGEPEDIEDYLNELPDKLFKYSWMVDPCITEDLYRKLFGKDSMLRFDGIQLTPEWEKKVYDIEKEVAEALKDESKGMGFCFSYWSTKTGVAAKHGIHWRSPRVMNPDVRFD